MNMVKQKYPEWYVFDIIEAKDNFQGKDDIDGRLCLFGMILYVPSTIFQLNRDWSSWVEPVLS